MIVLWGIPSESPFQLVREAVARTGAAHLILNQRRTLEWSVDLWHDAGRVRGAIRQGDDVIDAEAATGIYARPMDHRFLPEVEHGGPEELRRASQTHEALMQWLDVAPGQVINRPSPMMSNGSKPFQAQLIQSLGFDVPDTLVTSNAGEAEAFWRAHGRVIFKSVSGARSIVTELAEEHRPRLAFLRNCPAQFQEMVAGTDVRVHVVGGRAIATQIESTGTDYRYAAQDGGDSRLTPIELPGEIERRAIGLASGLGLAFAGIDLRRAHDGRWICFEVNPCPAFSYYEAHTGQPIAEAVAEFLTANGTGS